MKSDVMFISCRILALLVRAIGVFPRHLRLLHSLRRVFLRLVVLALTMVFGRRTMSLGSRVVLLRSFGVRFLRHLGFSVVKPPALMRSSGLSSGERSAVRLARTFAWQRHGSKFHYGRLLIAPLGAGIVARKLDVERAEKPMPGLGLSEHIVILVVEDDPWTRMVALDFIAEAGFEALEAANADEAIQILESRTDIHIVFTDIDMPGSMDGIKLAHAVRHRWPPIQFIVTSGYTMVDESQLPHGSRFFSKPYQPAKIIEAFRGLVA